MVTKTTFQTLYTHNTHQPFQVLKFQIKKNYISLLPKAISTLQTSVTTATILLQKQINSKLFHSFKKKKTSKSKSKSNKLSRREKQRRKKNKKSRGKSSKIVMLARVIWRSLQKWNFTTRKKNSSKNFRKRLTISKPKSMRKLERNRDKKKLNLMTILSVLLVRTWRIWQKRAVIISKSNLLNKRFSVNLPSFNSALSRE